VSVEPGEDPDSLVFKGEGKKKEEGGKTLKIFLILDQKKKERKPRAIWAAKGFASATSNSAGKRGGACRFRIA